MRSVRDQVRGHFGYEIWDRVSFQVWNKSRHEIRDVVHKNTDATSIRSYT